MTKVVHCKHEPYDILIDRTTKWGNPFTHIKTGKTLAKHVCKTRKEAIELYEPYLRQQLSEGKILIEDLLSLQDKTLGCWCKPKSCHGDIIVKLINEFNPDTF